MLSSGDRDIRSPLDEELVRGLKQRDYIEGRNLFIERRYSSERVSDDACELPAMQLDAVLTACTPSTHVMREATSSIPIVMANVSDPVRQTRGLTSNRRGGRKSQFRFKSTTASQRLRRWRRDVEPAAVGELEVVARVGKGEHHTVEARVILEAVDEPQSETAAAIHLHGFSASRVRVWRFEGDATSHWRKREKRRNVRYAPRGIGKPHAPQVASTQRSVSRPAQTHWRSSRLRASQNRGTEHKRLT